MPKNNKRGKGIEESAQRKQVEDWLRLLEKALETTQVGITITDVDGKIIYSNKADAELHGYTVEEIVGRDVRIFSPPELVNPMTAEQIKVKTGRKKETVNRRRDGSSFPAYLINDIVRNEAGEPIGMVTTCEDISDRKESEEQLRFLVERIQKIREDEKEKIGRDVSNNLGQLLTVLKFDLAWMLKRLGEDQKPLLEKIKKTLEHVESAIELGEKISSELRPTVLDDLGLVAGLEWQAKDFQNTTGIQCSLESEQDRIPLDGDLSTDIFRIFQEALADMKNDPNVTQIGAELKVENNLLVLKVLSNAGETKDVPEFISLMEMRERINHWGGDIKVCGTPGTGTTLTVTVPINGRNKGISWHLKS